MKEIIFVSLLVLLVGVSFSDIGNSTYNLLTNCTTAANKELGDYHTWINCLNRTSFVLNGSYTHKGGVLFLRGYDTYTFEVYNGSKKIHSNTTKQIVYILPSGNYTVKASKSGYIPKSENVKLNLGSFKYIYFELNQNTTKNQTQGGGGGLPTNTFVNISKDYIKQEIDSLKNVLNLSNEEVEYQKKVLDYVNVQVKYFLFTTESSNTLYYYVYNDWNQTINLTIVVEIPKEVSKNMSGIGLKTGYKLLKSDPIVSWNLNIGSGKSDYVEYTVTNKNITTVVPPVLLFSGIKLPKPKNQSILTNNTNTTNIIQNQTSQTNQTNQTAPKVKKEKKKINMNLIWIIIGIIVGISGVFIYFYFFKRKPHEVIEKSLNQIERFTG